LRGTFRARFARFGEKRGFDGRAPVPTALFYDVRDECGEIVTDHLWFTVGLQMKALALQSGDVVVFEARVSSYWKGYVSGRYDDDNWQPRQKDYRLSYPTKLRKVASDAASQDLPLFALTQEEA
jgi:hypothetical protein